jgi:hypothetical protein
MKSTKQIWKNNYNKKEKKRQNTVNYYYNLQCNWCWVNSSFPTSFNLYYFIKFITWFFSKTIFFNYISKKINYKKPSSIKKKKKEKLCQTHKLDNWGNLSFIDKFTNHVNLNKNKMKKNW